jgi:hypothetical protein
VTHTAKEAIWLRRLIEELFPDLLSPTTLCCDNQAALKLAINDNYHARTKHIDIVYCLTNDMTADILTKALPSWKVTHHTMGLGLRCAVFMLAGE